MQVVMNKCFFLNPEKTLVQIRIVVFEKNAPIIPKNDVTEPKARRLGYSNYQLKSCQQGKVSFRHPETMVSGSRKLACNLLTAYNWLLE